MLFITRCGIRIRMILIRDASINGVIINISLIYNKEIHLRGDHIRAMKIHPLFN